MTHAVAAKSGKHTKIQNKVFAVLAFINAIRASADVLPVLGEVYQPMLVRIPLHMAYYHAAVFVRREISHSFVVADNFIVDQILDMLVPKRFYFVDRNFFYDYHGCSDRNVFRRLSIKFKALRRIVEKNAVFLIMFADRGSGVTVHPIPFLISNAIIAILRR